MNRTPVQVAPAEMSQAATTLTHRADTAWIAANVFPSGGVDTLAAPTLAIVRVPGGRLPGPEGPFRFMLPLGVATEDGAYHLIWAESGARRPRPSIWGHRLESLWHAIHRAGGWSDPTEILNARFLPWDPHPGAVAVDGRGRLHLAVTTSAGGGLPRIAHLRLDSARWVRRDLGHPATAVTLLTLGRDSVIVAFAEPRTRRHGAERVAVVVSSDGGETWGAPHGVTRLPAGPPADLAAVADGAGRVHLVWGEKAERSTPFHLSRLRHWVSDAGTMSTWREASGAEVSGVTPGLHPVVGPEGDLVVFVESLEASGGPLKLRGEMVAWNADSAYRRPLFPDYAQVGKMAVDREEMDFHVLWTGVREGAKTGHTYLSTGRVCVNLAVANDRSDCH